MYGIKEVTEKDECVSELEFPCRSSTEHVAAIWIKHRQRNECYSEHKTEGRVAIAKQISSLWGFVCVCVRSLPTKLKAKQRRTVGWFNTGIYARTGSRAVLKDVILQIIDYNHSYKSFTVINNSDSLMNRKFKKAAFIVPLLHEVCRLSSVCTCWL